MKLFNYIVLIETHLNSQHNRKQHNSTKRGTLNCSIHKLTYSAVIDRVMYDVITATYHTSLNRSTISNIRLMVLFCGENNTNVFYIIKSSAAVRTHGIWPYLALPKKTTVLTVCLQTNDIFCVTGINTS